MNLEIIAMLCRLVITTGDAHLITTVQDAQIDCHAFYAECLTKQGLVQPHKCLILRKKERDQRLKK